MVEAQSRKSFSFKSLGKSIWNMSWWKKLGGAIVALLIFVAQETEKEAIKKLDVSPRIINAITGVFEDDPVFGQITKEISWGETSLGTTVVDGTMQCWTTGQIKVTSSPDFIPISNPNGLTGTVICQEPGGEILLDGLSGSTSWKTITGIKGDHRLIAEHWLQFWGNEMKFPTGCGSEPCQLVKLFYIQSDHAAIEIPLDPA